jgi:hypothetical protein
MDIVPNEIIFPCVKLTNFSFFWEGRGEKFIIFLISQNRGEKKKKKKKKLFQFIEWTLHFGIPALNCTTFLLGAFVVAMLTSLFSSWQELFMCTWFAKIYLKGTLGAMSLLRNDCLGPFVYCKKCPTFSWLGCWLWCSSLECSCVSHNACNLHGIRECVRRSPKSLIILMFFYSLASWNLGFPQH